MNHIRTRYQNGSLTTENRAKGAAVWVYRWREKHGDGTCTKRKQIIGTTVEFRTETAAWKAVESLHLNVNKVATASQSDGSKTVKEVVQHLREFELSNHHRTKRTKEVYESYLDGHILPKWGQYRLREVKAVEVERWFTQMDKAEGTKAKARSLLSLIFRHAQRYEFTSSNPIALVRQGAKRSKEPVILEAEEVFNLLEELSEPTKTIVLLAACTGLRRGELFGLKWEDIDFEKKRLRIVRSIVFQEVGQPKTATSRRPVEMAPSVEVALKDWRSTTQFALEGDWVFASPSALGLKPFWPESIYGNHIVPAIKAAGITKKVGWHTFRHTYTSLGLASGVGIRTLQELLGHSSPATTQRVYAQALTRDKQIAQNQIAALYQRQPGGLLIQAAS